MNEPTGPKCPNADKPKGALNVDNIAGSPASSALALTLIAKTIEQVIQNPPMDRVGWTMVAIQALGGLIGLLGK